jgi:hypothetical protein
MSPQTLYIPLYLGKSLIGGHLVPLHGCLIVLDHTLSAFVQSPNVALGIRIPLIGGLKIPLIAWERSLGTP